MVVKLGKFGVLCLIYITEFAHFQYSHIHQQSYGECLVLVASLYKSINMFTELVNYAYNFSY